MTLGGCYVLLPTGWLSYSSEVRSEMGGHFDKFLEDMNIEHSTRILVLCGSPIHDTSRSVSFSW